MTGRKKKEPRNHQLNLSLTEAEYKAVCQRAQTFGIRTAHYARMRIVSEKAEHIPASHKDGSALDRLIYNQLSRLGNLLNQIVRHLHRTEEPLPAGLEPLLDDIRHLMARLRR